MGSLFFANQTPNRTENFESRTKESSSIGAPIANPVAEEEEELFRFISGFVIEVSDRLCDQRPVLRAMFKFWGSQEPEAQPRPQESSQSWYSSSAASSTPTSSRPSTPGSSSYNEFSSQRPTERPQSPSHVSPAEAPGIINALKDKSVDELLKLLTDKNAYQQFLFSLDQVKIQNNVRDELRKETLQLARANVEKEPYMMELRNQCSIIRTTELAAAQEKLNELERQKEETVKLYSPMFLLQRLQEAIDKTDEESEILHKQLLEGEIEFAGFVQKHKKLRVAYHRRSLTHLAAKTSIG